MTLSTFSVPIDIPWERIAFSADMIDKQACDRELPLRWRSSVAVFEHEPPEDEQRVDGFTVSYLKVACTITGYQANGKEVRIRERVGHSGWDHKDDFLEKAVGAYYPCHGAMLEVVVAPPEDDDRFTFADYPYFADFDPKKRELYENVTDTGEVMSRSLEDVNVRLGRTTLESHEVKDVTTLSASLSGSYAGVTAAGSVKNEAGTTDLNQQGSENVRTTDAAREARETYSHTTQLSQMYNQLNSYHLGTNRAAFFVLPRPHAVQSVNTFVNGPREIEGIQEFMLAVVRPRRMEKYCVEAYLETAHLTGDPILDWGPTDVQLHLPPIDAPVTENDDHSYFNEVFGSASTPARAGYVIDVSRGGAGHGGYDLGPVQSTNLTDFEFIVGAETVTVNGHASGFWDNNSNTKYPAHLELTATVYQKKTVPVIAGYQDGLAITGRAVCSCGTERIGALAYDNGVSFVYESQLPNVKPRAKLDRGPMDIAEANQLGADIHREILSSLSSPDRYSRGTVGLLDTHRFAEMMGAQIRHADSETNARLDDWRGADAATVRQVTAYEPSITRAQLLEMPLQRQVETFGLSLEQAVALRRSLLKLDALAGPPPVPEHRESQVPVLTGLPIPEATRALITAGLRLGTSAMVDSPSPTGSVLRQQPAAGATVSPETPVDVTVASGLSVRLPPVIGLGLMEAGCRLRDAGLRREPTIEGDTGPDARVVTLDPETGTLVTPGTPVTVGLTG